MKDAYLEGGVGTRSDSDAHAATDAIIYFLCYTVFRLLDEYPGGIITRSLNAATWN